MTGSTRIFYLVTLMVITLVGLVAQPPDAKALFLQPLKITKVTAVVDETANTTTLTINGKNFSFQNFLEVSLGEVGELTIDGVPTDTEIVATWSAAIEPGDYLLTVAKGLLPHKRDTYDLTIGGVGPQGPVGPAGENGTNGQNGTNGSNGTDGSSCSIEGTVVSCTDGTSSDVGGSGSTGPTQPLVSERTQNFGSTLGGPFPRLVTANCLLGEVVVGGGFNLGVTSLNLAALQGIIVTTSQRSESPVTGSTDVIYGWTVIATEHTPTNLSWDLIAIAECMAPHAH